MNQLVCVLIFDMTKKYIFGFFLLIFVSNYFNFLGFNFLVRNLDTEDAPNLKKRTNLYFILMNCAYIATFGLAFVVWFGPWCSQDNLYPPVLTFCAILYWINCGYHYYLNKHGYFLRWIEPQEIDIASLSFKKSDSVAQS